jgi:glycosyltransferase involved in cell wall biosynthesis
MLHAQKPPRLVSKQWSSLATHARFKSAVSVVVPCHNEETNVEPLVVRLFELFGEYIHEVVLVDDNSIDNTRNVIRSLSVREARIKPLYRGPPNGVGRAITDGLQAATGEYILSLDCDFRDLLPEVRDLFDAVNDGYDVAVGSRFSRQSVLLNYPPAKIVANRMFHAIAQIALLARFRDLTNNLRLMRREVVDQLILLEPGFAINAEIGMQPLVGGFTVREVPISWIGRDIHMGTSSFRILKAGFGYWRVLCRLWSRRFFGVGPYASLVERFPRSKNPHGGLHRIRTAR